MKNKKFLLLILIYIASVATLQAQIEAVECYTSTGRPISPGGQWHETHNGVDYECTCRKSGGPDCAPVNSSSSGSSSSSGDYRTEIIQYAAQKVVGNLLDWLFSSSTNDNSSDNTYSVSTSTYSYERTEEEKQRDAELHKK